MKLTFKNLFKILGLDKVDWKKATTRLLAVLWGVLIFSWFCKIFLGKQFNIMTSNENYVNICNFFSQKPYVLIIPFPFYVLSCYLTVLIILRKIPSKKHVLFFIPIISFYVIKIFNNNLGFALEVLMYILISIKISKRPWRALETIFITILFQYISLITKNIGSTMQNDDVFTNMIFFIDYYIMMSIYCINTILRKEGIIMGLWGPFLLSRKAKQLTAYREKLVTKKIKLDSRIREIDRAIENEKCK